MHRCCIDVSCPFCVEVLAPLHNPLLRYGVHSRIVKKSRYWFCIPTVGCFVNGYVLLVSKTHYACASSVSNREMTDLMHFISQVGDVIKVLFDVPYICFEHGTLNPDYAGANSVNHAHMHMLPCKQKLWPSICSQYSIKNFLSFPNLVSLYSYLKENEIPSYLMFCDSDEKAYLIENGADFPSQFFRKAIANQLGCSTEWDWKSNPCLDNMYNTFRFFESAL